MTKLFANLLIHWGRDASPDGLDRTAPLLLMLPPQVPPFGLLARIEDELDRLETRNGAAVNGKSWRPGLLLPAGLAGAFAGAVGLAYMMLLQPPATCDPVRVASLQIEGISPGIGVESIECGRYLRLSHAGLQAEDGHALEIWLIPQDSGVPQSLGLVTAKGTNTILPVSMALMAGDTLAVSREPSSGSPAAGPSGPVLATAEIGQAG